MTAMNTGNPTSVRPGSWWGAGCFALLLVLLWVFPDFWYHTSAEKGRFIWLGEQSVIPGWTFTNIPISKAAEAILVGDRMLSGEFGREGKQQSIRVFSAKRYLEKENEIGLFSHTPDRCWTEGGWQIKLVEPQYVDLTVHGVQIRFERRWFVADVQSELVYFGAVVGGKPLPYRLDQYLNACLKRTGATRTDAGNTWTRLRNTRVWGWAWDSFVNRTAIGGPQQFIRISTPVVGSDLGDADAALQGFLPKWLHPVDYDSEFSEWKRSDGARTKAS